MMADATNPNDSTAQGTHAGLYEDVTVRIETAHGTITVALSAKAPRTTENFLWYVDQGAYDGGRFHRTVTLENQSNTNLKSDEAIGAGIDPDADGPLPNDAVAIEVIQGGVNPTGSTPSREPISLERTRDTGLSHTDGAISMARRSVDSAVSDFFICINDQPELDYGGARNEDGQGFAAFGQVLEGMDVVRAIQRQPADGQSLTPPVEIRAIMRA